MYTPSLSFVYAVVGNLVELSVADAVARQRSQNVGQRAQQRQGRVAAGDYLVQIR